ncbi:metal-dependent hydrolase [Candidatus Pacearchaeota archaeon]|nr:metal-dependent hydrolase [Candidatus Pacearchaeota archaeon]
MNFAGHAIGSSIISIGAVGITTAISPETEPKTLAIIAVCIILGGLFPDIDTASIPSRWYSILMCISLPIFWHYDMPWHWIAVLIPYVAAKSFRHRFWTHSINLPFVLLFLTNAGQFITIAMPDSMMTVKLYIQDFQFEIICFALGIVSHLLFDSRIFKGIGR